MGYFLFEQLLNQLFPESCFICKKQDVFLCLDCQKKMSFQPQWQTLQSIPVWSAYDYHDSIHSQLIRAWKYQGKEELADLLVEPVILPDISHVDLIIPVPLHKKKYCKRGFNQSEQLAEFLAKQYKSPISKDLYRKKSTPQQAGLNKQQRIVNVKGAFEWRGRELKNASIVLIDDVVSTGSTLQACSDVLQKNGAKKITAICLFRGGK